MIGAENVIEDVCGDDSVLEIVGDKEIVDTPAYIPLTGLHPV